MMKFYEGFRQQTSGEKVLCLECGATNQAGAEACENCGSPLYKPAPFFQNLLQTIILPGRAMPRIAATSPVTQAFLVVILGVLAFIISGALSIQQSYQDLLGAVNQYNDGKPDLLRQYLLRPEQPLTDLPKAISDFTTNSNSNALIPGVPWIIFYFVLLIVSWFFFTISLYYSLRLLFRTTARINYFSLLAVVGFSRITMLLTVIYLLPANVTIGSILSILVLVWQVVLLVIGTKASTGLNLNRAAIAVVIPVLIFQFLLKFPI